MDLIKNKKILFISSLTLLFSALPKFVLADTGSLSWAGRLISGIPAATIGMIFGIVAKLTGLFALMMSNLLNWVIGPNFLSWSWTQPGGDNPNPIINVGLNITKDFVNLGLVLILIFIAFSVALRLKQYATEKTLVRLIIIALLVNFAPVMCGLIVDAANIIMNFFLQGVEKGVANMLTGREADSILTDLWNLFTGSLTAKMSILTEASVLIVLNIAIGIAFFLLTAIFLFRYVAIWVLVILSPLAFLALILPATKKFWDKWWDQFIQWSFIGIPMAFFLYLAMASFGALQAEFAGKMAMPGLDSGVVNRLDMAFPYFVVVALMGLGFIVGLSSSAMGSAAIVNYTKTKGNKMIAGAREKAKMGAKIVGTKTKNKLSSIKGLREWGEKQASARKWGEGDKRKRGTWKRAASAINPVRYVRRGLGKTISTGVVESEQAMTKKAEERNKNTRVEKKQEHYHHAMTDNQRLGAINSAIKEGQIDDLMDSKKFGKSAVSEAEIERIRNRVKKYDSHKTIERSFPQIAAKHVTATELSDARAKDPRITNRERFVVSKMKPADYGNISKSALKNVRVVDAMIVTAMGSHIQKLIDSQGRYAAQRIETVANARAAARSKITGIPTTAGQYIKAENPRMHKSVKGGAGTGLLNI